MIESISLNTQNVLDEQNRFAVSSIAPQAELDSTGIDINSFKGLEFTEPSAQLLPTQHLLSGISYYSSYLTEIYEDEDDIKPSKETVDLFSRNLFYLNKALKDRLVEDCKDPLKKGDVESIVRFLNSNDKLDTIDPIFGSEEMSLEGLISLSVATMNSAGIIPTVDRIAGLIKKYPERAVLLTQVYNTLQGDEVLEVRESLEEVYSRINFGEYHINTEELTDREMIFIDELTEMHLLSHPGEAVGDLIALDIAAGTGRHSQRLVQRGSGNRLLRYKPGAF